MTVSLGQLPPALCDVCKSAPRVFSVLRCSIASASRAPEALMAVMRWQGQVAEHVRGPPAPALRRRVREPQHVHQARHRGVAGAQRLPRGVLLPVLPLQPRWHPFVPHLPRGAPPPPPTQAHTHPRRCPHPAHSPCNHPNPPSHESRCRVGALSCRSVAERCSMQRSVARSCCCMRCLNLPACNFAIMPAGDDGPRYVATKSAGLYSAS